MAQIMEAAHGWFNLICPVRPDQSLGLQELSPLAIISLFILGVADSAPGAATILGRKRRTDIQRNRHGVDDSGSIISGCSQGQGV